MKKVLIGCEYSGTVRDAFRRKGFDAWSCDILPTEGDPSYHMQGDIVGLLGTTEWDLIILHPPCTAMAVCGNKHYAAGTKGNAERREAIRWALRLAMLATGSSAHVAIENPASVIFPHLRNGLGLRTQYIQPWQHGHPEQKKTGFALKNLPDLQPTNNVYDHMMTLPRNQRERIFMMTPSENRGLERSRFYPGIAEAMADQWGRYIMEQDA